MSVHSTLVLMYQGINDNLVAGKDNKVDDWRELSRVLTQAAAEIEHLNAKFARVLFELQTERSYATASREELNALREQTRSGYQGEG